MEYNDLVRARRSIRRYKDDPVPKEALERILQAARLAPSWKNQQCWRFILVDDREKRERLSGLIAGNPSEKAVAQAPCTLVVCALPQESGHEDGKPYYLADGGVVMAQILLAAANEGLGGVFVGLFDEQKLRDILEIPPSVSVVGFTPIGYPDQQPKDRGRKPLDELLFHNRWED